MPTVPEMTPELLAQLERTALHFTAAGGFDDDIQVAEALASIPALVAAAKERDQLREAARLREHATLEAWSGSLVGLDAAEAASAQAEAIEALAGIVAPTAEQQRDAALTKLAAVLIERKRLDVALSDRKFEIEQLSELLGQSQWDRVNLTEQVDQLRAEVERLRGLGLEAIEVLEYITEDLPETVHADRIARLRAEIERKP